MEEDLTLYPDHIVDLARKPLHLGRMNDPTSSASLKGPCGDEMEFYLVNKDEIIEEIKFYSQGCIATLVCGSMTAQLARG